MTATIQYRVSRGTEPFIIIDSPNVAEACSKAGFWVRSDVQ